MFGCVTTHHQTGALNNSDNLVLLMTLSFSGAEWGEPTSTPLSNNAGSSEVGSLFSHISALDAGWQLGTPLGWLAGTREDMASPWDIGFLTA